METLKNVIAISAMVLLALACEEKEQIEVSPIIGDWVGIKWYCHNPMPAGSCINLFPEDTAATFEFKIYQVEGVLKATDGVLKLPSCPSCTLPSRFDSLYFEPFYKSKSIDEPGPVIYIKWKTHSTNHGANWFAFTVGLAHVKAGVYDRFKGSVMSGYDTDPDHAGGEGQYIWAYPVEIIKKK